MELATGKEGDHRPPLARVEADFEKMPVLSIDRSTDGLEIGPRTGGRACLPSQTIGLRSGEQKAS